MTIYDEELARLSALAREAWPGRAHKVVRGDYRDGLPTYEVLGADADGSPAAFLYVEAHPLGILAMGAALRVLAHGLPAHAAAHAAARERVQHEADSIEARVAAASGVPLDCVALARGWLFEARQYRELADGGGDNLWQRERYAHAAGVLERCAEELFARFAAERNER